MIKLWKALLKLEANTKNIREVYFRTKKNPLMGVCGKGTWQLQNVEHHLLPPLPANCICGCEGEAQAPSLTYEDRKIPQETNRNQIVVQSGL